MDPDFEVRYVASTDEVSRVERVPSEPPPLPPRQTGNNYRAIFEQSGPSWGREAGLNTIKLSEVSLLNCIGAGGFGKVYRSTINPAGRERYEAAVKIPHSNHTSEQDNSGLKQEALIFSLLQHQNILRMMGLICDGNTNYGLALEFCSGGPLNQWLKHYPGVLSLSLSIDWSLQVASGMEYLHKRAPAKLLHRDLKSSNVLLFHPGSCQPEKQVLKISDFGLARARQEQRSREEFSAAGTYAWMAPESIRSNNFSPFSDVWSFGVLLWEILTGEQPYRGLEPLQVAFSVAHRQMRLPIPSSIPEILSNLMKNCWEEEAHNRPEFDAITLRLEAAKHELANFDKSGEYKSLQTTWRKEVCGMLEDLKEKAGELRSKEVELKERELAVVRRQKDLQQRELDVVQREISVLLKEKQVEESLSRQKKKKKRDSGLISRPKTFEHIVSVRTKPHDGALQVVEPRAKTWGHKNGELAAQHINKLSSSTSDLDRMGKGQKQFEFCESKLVHVAKILAGIGSGRDVFEHAQPGVSRPPDYVIDQEFLNPFAKLPQRHSIQSQLSIPHQAPSKVQTQSDSAVPDILQSSPQLSSKNTSFKGEHKKLTTTCSSPPSSVSARTRPRGRPPGHRRVPSEPIESRDIARIADQLESTNQMKRQEKMLNGTIMAQPITPINPPSNQKPSARPRSAGPPTSRLSLIKPIPINSSVSAPSNRTSQNFPQSQSSSINQSPVLPNKLNHVSKVSASDLFRAASAGQLGVGLAPESEILNSSGLVNSSSHNPLDDPIIEDHRPSIL